MSTTQYAPRNPSLPSPEDMARAGEFLRAAELARHWLTMTSAERPERLAPFRCFVLGAMAAWKDRA